MVEFHNEAACFGSALKAQPRLVISMLVLNLPIARLYLLESSHEISRETGMDISLKNV